MQVEAKDRIPTVDKAIETEAALQRKKDRAVRMAQRRRAVTDG